MKDIVENPILNFSSWMKWIQFEVEKKLVDFCDNKIKILRSVGKDSETLGAVIRDFTLRGGKRFRPAMAALSFVATDPNAPMDVIFQAGAALELFQTYLLIQDDWMDGDLIRRGGPSVHTWFSNQIKDSHLGAGLALLASDLSWSYSCQIVQDLPVDLSRKSSALRKLFEMNDDVILGQQLDLLGNAKDVEQMHSLKTGSYTVLGPLHFGAMLACEKVNHLWLQDLTHFASPLGIAFQLRDDLLGTFGNEANTGKPVGSDLRSGKRTSIIVEAEKIWTQSEKDMILKIFGNRKASVQDVVSATQWLSECGAKQAVEKRLEELCKKAKSVAIHFSILEQHRKLFVDVCDMMGDII